MSDSSCVVEQLETFASLSEGDKQLLAELERDIQCYPAGQILRTVDQRHPPFYTLRRGWACSTRLLPDGQRQVLEIFIDGQVMGLSEMGLEYAQTELIALTDIEACPFPPRSFMRVLSESASLSSLFFMTLARDHAMLRERIMNIGKRRGVERLAHFLLEVRFRRAEDSNEIEIPINQTVIGDALGMSSVHVSRSFSLLKKMELLETDGRLFRLLDPDAMARFCSFCPKYLVPRSNHALSTELLDFRHRMSPASEAVQ